MKRMPFASYRSGRTARSEQHQNRIPHRFMIYGMLGLTFAGIAGLSSIGGYANAAEIPVRSDRDEEAAGKVLFTAVGHYDFAVAGNINVYHGSSFENHKDTSVLIKPSDNSNLPSNWDQIAQQIATDHDGKVVDNLSGSKLNIGNGKVKYAKFRDFHCDDNLDVVTVIGPKGGTVDVSRSHDLTAFVNEQGDGWYFVTYQDIDARECNQASWSIAAVYEDSALPVSRVELINSDGRVSNDAVTHPDVPKTREILFNRSVTPNGDTDLLGVYLAAGKDAWDQGATTSTQDSTTMLFSDGTSKVLEASSDNGTTRFAGREADNFAKILFKDTLGSSNLSHSIVGGELDIFYEEGVTANFTSNKAISGYKFEKIGENILSPSIFGYRKGLSAELEVEATISDDDPTHPTVTLTNADSQIACGIKMIIPLETLGKPTDISIEPTTGVTHETIDGNLIINAASLAASAKISLKLTIPEPTAESVSINPSVTYFPSDEGVCEDYITNDATLAYTAKDEDAIYRVLVQYQDESGKELQESTHFYAHSGDDYTTKAATIEGYTLIATPDNHEGIVENKAITVTYVYKPTVAVPNTGLFTGDKNYLLPVGISVAGLAGAGLAAWFIRRKLTSKHVGFNK